MKVAVIGGGPAGLYFSLLLKQARPAADITVLERNRPDDTFGWGVGLRKYTVVRFTELVNNAAIDDAVFASQDSSTLGQARQAPQS